MDCNGNHSHVAWSPWPLPLAPFAGDPWPAAGVPSWPVPCCSPGARSAPVPPRRTGRRPRRGSSGSWRPRNFWGSIAGQIGGTHARVVSIITNPNTDPHAYEPTAPDARTLATANLVIENGIGYDPWVQKLLAGDRSRSTVLDVGTVAGVAAGAIPTGGTTRPMSSS